MHEANEGFSKLIVGLSNPKLLLEEEQLEHEVLTLIGMLFNKHTNILNKNKIN